MTNAYWKYVTSIDPGETAGVVQATRTSTGCVIAWTGEVVWDDWTAWKEILELSGLVVCENFRIRPAKVRHLGGSQVETVRLIGFLQGTCALSGKEFILSEPGNKTFYDRKRLKELGFEHSSQHVRDAASHLFWYVRRLRSEKETHYNEL